MDITKREFFFFVSTCGEQANISLIHTRLSVSVCFIFYVLFSKLSLPRVYKVVFVVSIVTMRATTLLMSRQ